MKSIKEKILFALVAILLCIMAGFLLSDALKAL